MVLISVIQDVSQNSRQHVHIPGSRKEELMNKEGESFIPATFKKRFKEVVTLLFDYPSAIGQSLVSGPMEHEKYSLYSKY